jgi:CheY-like chemotaxis protein
MLPSDDKQPLITHIEDKVMKVLVIDDAARNIEAAHTTLKEHEVTTCSTIQDAYSVLERNKGSYDAVLTDLFLPLGSFRGAMSGSAEKPDEELPAGLIFALKAASLGIPVVICTDADHHQSWICTLLDLIRIGWYKNQRVTYVEARYVPLGTDEEPVTKNWLEVLYLAGLLSRPG